MHLSYLLTSILAVGALALPQSLGGGGDGNQPPSGKCTKQQRLKNLQLVIDSYNAVAPGASAAGFAKLPVKDNCVTEIYPNDSPVPAIVAVDGTGTRNFALSSRQAFSKVTGAFTDYANGTSIIHTNVTAGAAHSIAFPATFYADVVFDHDLKDCLWRSVIAYADIPTVLLGQAINPPKFPSA